jgi:pimeloyl-ACP methyl ester carboxylesterase
MYDFSARREGDALAGAAPDGPEPLPAPSWLLTACELGRLSVELPASVVVDAVTPAPDEGLGRPVLVLPGFSSPDSATRRGRQHLGRLGYRAHGWGLGRNHGLIDPIIDGVLARLDQLHEEYDEPVRVVGWSFGGLLARWLAHQRPASVRQVVCLGSPYRPEGEHTRTTPLFERSARTHGLSERAFEVVDTLRRPLPVPVTAIYSRTDGIVNWRACRLTDAELAAGRSDNIGVPSSHVGLLANPLSLAALTDRLAQDPDDWQPFDWTTCLTRTVLGRPRGHGHAAGSATQLEAVGS